MRNSFGAGVFMLEKFLDRWEFDNYEEKYKPMDYIISDSLYRIYDDDSINSLSSEYRKQKKLGLDNVK